MGLFTKDNISAKILLSYFEQNASVPAIVDIRADDEFDDYHIKGSINIPLDDWINNGKAFLPEGDPTQEIIVVCNMGIKSYDARTDLVKRGYKNAKVLKNGISAWYDMRAQTDKYSVVKNK